MKNDKDINNSLSEIKKALTEKKAAKINNTEPLDFFLLKDVIKKGKVLSDATKNSELDIAINEKKDKKPTKRINMVKKNKSKKYKVEQFKKPLNKINPVENVINKEIRPIIKNWIQKNLRAFVKKVVVEEFKGISKAAFKQKSISK